MSTMTRPRVHACVIGATVAIAALACGGSARAQTVPAAPGALQVTARSETSLSLQWKDRSRSEAYYKVRVSGRVRRLSADRQAVTVSGLRPSVVYRVAVQACSHAGRCSKAVTGTATTARARPAPAPSSSPPGPGTVTEPAPIDAPLAPTSPPAPTATVDVTGMVTVTTGDCMPTIGGTGDPINPCRTSPTAGARVLLYAPVLTYSAGHSGTLDGGLRTPSAQATTDASGRYHLVVEPGTYSFLVDAGTGPECGSFDANGALCPHTLLAPGQTVDLNLNHAVW
ncbi:MAG TPA: fibronectin type III domain-containing protein [Baekduia sp.]|nr:fibronectin type III domain-containing protein [Baekduia sp.]